MASKTPYEIRTELLQQAQSILFEKIMAERLRLENDWNMKREEWSMRACNNDFGPTPSFPELPVLTAEEVIEVAKKLNDFVSSGS